MQQFVFFMLQSISINLNPASLSMTFCTVRLAFYIHADQVQLFLVYLGSFKRCYEVFPMSQWYLACGDNNCL